MTDAVLYRLDPAKNMRRYYRLSVQVDLFGQWCLIREWGRVGGGCQVRTTAFPSPSEAEAALDRCRRRKVRRGYC